MLANVPRVLSSIMNMQCLVEVYTYNFCKYVRQTCARIA